MCVCAGSMTAYLQALQQDSPQMWPASLVRERMQAVAVGVAVMEHNVHTCLFDCVRFC